MKRRILLVNIPQLLRDLITDCLAEQPNAKVVEDDATIDEAVAAARTGDADFVIVGTSDESLPAELRGLLSDRAPRLAVLGVADDGKQGYLHELRPQRSPLVPLTRDRLITAIGAESEGGQ